MVAERKERHWHFCMATLARINRLASASGTAQRSECGRRNRSRPDARIGEREDRARASAPTPASRTAWSASATSDGVLFVNDSKATNPTATAPALAAFERIRWICGGQAKTDNLDECLPHLGHVRAAYTIGEAADLFERLLSPHIPVKNCGKLDAAVRQAAADSEAGDTVLLSPACASFDQFRDFEDRGDQFRRLVGAL